MKMKFFTQDDIPALANAVRTFKIGSGISTIGGVIVIAGTVIQAKGVHQHNKAVELVTETFLNGDGTP